MRTAWEQPGSIVTAIADIVRREIRSAIVLSAEPIRPPPARLDLERTALATILGGGSGARACVECLRGSSAFASPFYQAVFDVLADRPIVPDSDPAPRVGPLLEPLRDRGWYGAAVREDLEGIDRLVPVLARPEAVCAELRRLEIVRRRLECLEHAAAALRRDEDPSPWLARELASRGREGAGPRPDMTP